MVHVARQMEREGCQVPLLIGGATTSKAHTAVKIAPAYQHPVVHVLDASRAVPVVGSLLSPEQKPAFVQKVQADYERVRVQHAGPKQKLIPLAEARARAPQFDWAAYAPPQPAWTGLCVVCSDGGLGTPVSPAAQPPDRSSALARRTVSISLSDLVPFIDWTPFFHTWELRGRFPSILQHPRHGREASQLYSDAQALLEKIVADRRLLARGVYGFFPANAVGDDVELYADDTRLRRLTVFHFLRQQMQKPDGQSHFCFADFVAPKLTPHTSSAAFGAAPPAPFQDYLGAFAVTAGHGLKDFLDQCKADHDDYQAIMAEALADRLAEAFAEYLHKRVRDEWGFGQQEHLSHDDLIEEKYRGIRPAAGYPACPDHTEKRILWELLEVEGNAGIRLTETCAMWPGSSVSGLYFSHPGSKYFGVGKLDRDQLLDYHLRKGMTLQEAEKWLRPNLDYDPD
jgi:5-methyltetrahydrofolate--homocysteine methyltransferase